MNFIEAVKLLELDKNIKLRRRSKDFEITSDNIGIFFIAEGVFLKGERYREEPFAPSFDEILAEDWYVVKDEKLHTFEEALKAYKSGKTIRRKDHIIVYVYSEFCCIFDYDDVMANDWIINDE